MATTFRPRQDQRRRLLVSLRSIANTFQRMQRSVRSHLRVNRSTTNNTGSDNPVNPDDHQNHLNSQDHHNPANPENHHDSIDRLSLGDAISSWQPAAVGTFVMSSARNTRHATGQLRVNHDMARQPPRRSRRVAGEAPEAGPYSPPRRPRQDTQLHAAPPSSEFTFSRPDPPIPAPGFQSTTSTSVATNIAPSIDLPSTTAPISHLTDHTLVSDILQGLGHQATPAQPQGLTIKTEEPPEEKMKKECVACCEADHAPLYQPCRSCTRFWCAECIRTMFLNATRDTTSMPPRCCAIIQITVGLKHLTTSEAEDYRLKFEEWLSTKKTYCPVPTCSKFIPDRAILPPPPKLEVNLWGLLKQELPGILAYLEKQDCAKFFRGPLDPAAHGIRDYSKIAKKPTVWLKDITAKLPLYADLEQFTSDFNRVTVNTRYWPPTSALVTSGEELRKRFWQEVSKIQARPNGSFAKLPAGACFSCPECHIAICPSCKQIAHLGQPCDTTAQDHELALLETYGYKQCPRCGHGVKRMYGCRHMQCRCGAHWCWGCSRSIEECDGECTSPTAESEDDYQSDEETELDAPAAGPPQVGEASQQNADTLVAGPPEIGETGQQNAGTTASVSQNELRPTNLDAGGRRVWEAAGLFFGEEPDEGRGEPMWLCSHVFGRAQLPAAAARRGVPLETECFRCFSKISMGVSDAQLGEGLTAWECESCEMMVCSDCKEELPQGTSF